MTTLKNALSAVAAMDAAIAVVNATPEWEPRNGWDSDVEDWDHRPDDHPETLAVAACGRASHAASQACIAYVRTLATQHEGAVDAGIELVAKHFQKKWEAFWQECGSYDPSTGFTEFPSEDEDRQLEILELVQEIRSLASECTIPPAGWACTRKPGHDGPCAATAIPGGEVEMSSPPTTMFGKWEGVTAWIAEAANAIDKAYGPQAQLPKEALRVAAAVTGLLESIQGGTRAVTLNYELPIVKFSPAATIRLDAAIAHVKGEK